MPQPPAPPSAKTSSAAQGRVLIWFTGAPVVEAFGRTHFAPRRRWSQAEQRTCQVCKVSELAQSVGWPGARLDTRTGRADATLYYPSGHERGRGGFRGGRDRAGSGFDLGNVLRYGLSVLLGLMLVAASSTPVDLSLQDCDGMDRAQRVRLLADLAFEIERHLGVPVRAAEAPEQCPGPEVSDGVSVKAYLAVTQVRLVLEDRRAQGGGRTAFGDVDWPLSVNRETVQGLLNRLLGPATSTPPLAGVQADAQPASASDTGSNAVPIAFGLLGTALAGASLGLVAVGLDRGGDDGLPSLHADGEAQQVSIISTVAVVGLILAGSALATSVVSALAQSN